MWFPIDTETATVQNSVWEIDFGPYNENRVIEFITLQGPESSTCSVYLDTVFMDTTSRGDFNRADYPNGIPFARGRLLRLVWNVGSGTAPSAPRASLGMTDGNPRADNAGNSTIYSY